MSAIAVRLRVEEREKREQVDDVRSGLLVLEGLELDGLDAHGGGEEVESRARMRMKEKEKQRNRL